MSDNEAASSHSALSAAQAEASSPSTDSGSPPENLDPNWQCATIREKLAAMFERQLMTDFTFIVGEVGITKTIPIHKNILGMSSPVFYAMFNGGLASREPETVIPDIEPTTFLIFLKFIDAEERYRNRYGYSSYNSQTPERHSIFFLVDKAVYIVGLGIYCNNSTYRFKIELKESDRVIAAAENGKCDANGVVPTDNILRTYFPYPVQIRAMCNYSANVICEYFSEYLGCGGVFKKVSAGPVTFKFENCSDESSDESQLTTVSEGQIPEIIYYNV